MLRLDGQGYHLLRLQRLEDSQGQQSVSQQLHPSHSMACSTQQLISLLCQFCYGTLRITDRIELFQNVAALINMELWIVVGNFLVFGHLQ